jgi:hypothetical protein
MLSDRLSGLNGKVYRTDPVQKSERKTQEEEFRKFIRKKFFGLIPTYLNVTECVRALGHSFSILYNFVDFIAFEEQYMTGIGKILYRFALIHAAASGIRQVRAVLKFSIACNLF